MKSFLPLLSSTWGHRAELSHIHVPHITPPSRTLLPVWWGPLPAGGFCDQPPHLGAAARASGGCLSASECCPDVWGSSGWAPSPSSSHLHIRPYVNCTLLQEPSTRTGNVSAQLIPHQPREKSGWRVAPTLCYSRAACISKSLMSYLLNTSPFTLIFLGQEKKVRKTETSNIFFAH